MAEPNYPLGAPINRAPPGQGLTPIAGRPNWFRDRHGAERYIEPPKPPKWFPVI